MKIIYVLIASIFILSSCKKEVQQPTLTKPSTVSTSSRTPVIFNYSHEDIWNTTVFDSCTQENVLVTNDITTTLHTATKGDTVKYNYAVSILGTKGVGLTSGVKYTGQGGVTQTFTAVIQNGQYHVIGEAYTYNYVTFKAPGRDNDLSSVAYYVFHTDSNGFPVFDIEYTHWNFCK